MPGCFLSRSILVLDSVLIKLTGILFCLGHVSLRVFLIVLGFMGNGVNLECYIVNDLSSSIDWKIKVQGRVVHAILILEL